MLDANRKVLQRAAEVADAIEGFDREPVLMRRTLLAALEGLGHGGLLVAPHEYRSVSVATAIPVPFPGPEQSK